MTEHDPIAGEIILCIPALRRFARTFNHRAIDSDDLVQETLLKALPHIEKFHLGTNLRAWFFTIMRNSFCSRARLAKRESPGFSADCCDLATAAPANKEWHIRGHEDAISRLRRMK
ncbi:RNA polymerase sigma factor (sigma-70 family) [Mycoplana sp. BE70]|uniref:sigma factor n=1 Tax=Mycoplana sp. BE70 TaxID=2817775 RepID=UPI002864CD2C|nr:sigma factor [Mycoplana sp. BE70]MDR6758925.1 RNA polymerase sigma factor (sigma-70 family) [Mycoplana sp. BE70]